MAPLHAEPRSGPRKKVGVVAGILARRLLRPRLAPLALVPAECRERASHWMQYCRDLISAPAWRAGRARVVIHLAECPQGAANRQLLRGGASESR